MAELEALKLTLDMLTAAQDKQHQMPLIQSLRDQLLSLSTLDGKDTREYTRCALEDAARSHNALQTQSHLDASAKGLQQLRTEVSAYHILSSTELPAAKDAAEMKSVIEAAAHQAAEKEDTLKDLSVRYNTLVVNIDRQRQQVSTAVLDGENFVFSHVLQAENGVLILKYEYSIVGYTVPGIVRMDNVSRVEIGRDAVTLYEVDDDSAHVVPKPVYQEILNWYTAENKQPCWET